MLVDNLRYPQLQLFGILYSLNFIFCLCNPTFQYLSSKSSGGNTAHYIRGLREKKMYVTNSIACWHTERRTTGTGKNRRTKTVTVYTYRATEQFNYEYCMDRTPAGIHCGDFSVVRVDTRVEYEWGNHETRQAFEAHGQRMRIEHQHRDKNISHTTKFQVMGVEDRKLLILDGADAPKFSRLWYTLSMLLFCAPMYQIWFERRAGQANLCCKKKLFLRAADAPPVNVEAVLSPPQMPEASAVPIYSEIDDVIEVHAVPITTANENEYWQRLEALHAENQMRGIQGFIRRGDEENPPPPPPFYEAGAITHTLSL